MAITRGTGPNVLPTPDPTQPPAPPRPTSPVPGITAAPPGAQRPVADLRATPVHSRMPNSTPIVPVAGVSVADLVDSFGASRDGGSRAHKGIDIFAPTGTPVIAAVSGTVTRAGDSGGKGGLRVWIKGDDGFYHFYAHLSQVNATPGMRVQAGQPIGRVGDTGNAKGTDPHLHYSVNTVDSAETGTVNPWVYLQNGVASEQSYTPWVQADLSLDSDDDGPLDPEVPEQTFNQWFTASLDAVSQILAGGQRVDPGQILLPMTTGPTVGEEGEGGEGEGGHDHGDGHDHGGSGGSGGSFTPGDTGNPDRDFIINRENQGWDPAIFNGGGTERAPDGSSAFGLGQIIESNRLHYAKVLGVDPNTTDPWEQIAMMDAYVEDRYGSYAAARDFHEQNNWY